MWGRSDTKRVGLEPGIVQSRAQTNAIEGLVEMAVDVLSAVRMALITSNLASNIVECKARGTS